MILSIEEGVGMLVASYRSVMVVSICVVDMVVVASCKNTVVSMLVLMVVD